MAFYLWGCIPLTFSVSHSIESIVGVEYVLELQKRFRPSLSPLPSLVELGLRATCGFNVCFLSVTLLNGSACANDFAIKALEYRNNFCVVG